MGHHLFDIQLHLLIHASPLGVSAACEASDAELRVLCTLGLLRSDPLGPCRLTPLGAAALQANLVGSGERKATAPGPEGVTVTDSPPNGGAHATGVSRPV